MSAFHEVSLPLAVAIGAVGGPERMTDVVRLASGAESRNARWSQSRRRWEIGGAAMKADVAHDLIAFFEARRGRAHGFRFRDPVDWKSCAPGVAISAADQPLGVGDGETTAFQLVKRYVSGGEWAERVIAKPVSGSVIVAVDGAAVAGFGVDHATGVVTFDAAPDEGAILTAGFLFDVPLRFDADRLEMALVGHEAVRVLRAPLVELAG
jgi:uncharacterized protein (TIGR02217 family)